MVVYRSLSIGIIVCVFHDRSRFTHNRFLLHLCLAYTYYCSCISIDQKDLVNFTTFLI
ncbi:hypothetical protein BVRB_5g107240 [Beta vulgaris subsp. vulgaris]|nr:hypothetical protein BVRB_5g107240 [Beta vulgaris subsp. vulgaris]